MSIRTGLSVIWQYLQITFFFLFWRRYACGCGHRSRYKVGHKVDGYRGIWTLGKKRDYCARCWFAAAIKCAWCGKTILPESAITLMAPAAADFKIPDHAVVYKRTPHLQLVGCLRWNCADSGMDRAGFWVMPGKVHRVVSPLEMMIYGNQDDIVIINDVTNIKEAISIPDKIAKPGV